MNKEEEVIKMAKHIKGRKKTLKTEGGIIRIKAFEALSVGRKTQIWINLRFVNFKTGRAAVSKCELGLPGSARLSANQYIIIHNNVILSFHSYLSQVQNFLEPVGHKVISLGQLTEHMLVSSRV